MEARKIDESKFMEKLAIVFMWLVVIGSGLLGIGLAFMHEIPAY
jgi:hypothetical protein